MNTKPPIRLAEAASAQNVRIRKPLTLKEIPQQNGTCQRTDRTQASGLSHAGTPKPPASAGRPVNRAQVSGVPYAGTPKPAASAGRPMNRAQASVPSSAAPPQRMSGQTNPPGRHPLSGIKPGLEMKKGQKASLTQKSPGLAELEVRMGWRTKDPACELDVSAFLLGADNRVPGEAWFVFYGQPESPDGSVIHLGDRCADDRAAIRMDLRKVRPDIKRIVFILTINEALRRGLNFGMVEDIYIRVVDPLTKSELLRFMMEETYSNVISMVVGEIYERNGEWKINAVGNGVARDLPELCESYGVQASY